MEQLRRTLETIRQYLGGLTVSQKLLIGALSVLAVMTLFLVSQYAARPQMVELLPGASAEHQQRVVTHLQSSGAPHEVRGGRVFVPTERQRLVLAQLGESGKLPDDTSILFSNLLEKQHWMHPRSQNEQIFNIALQNELARVISNFRGIRSAMVIIDAPEPHGLGMAYRRPTASATVFTENGRSLDSNTVDAIAAMIAGARSGLDAAQVRVIDGTTGRQYRARAEDDFAATSYMEHVAKVEQWVQEKLVNHLAYIPGVVVAVNAQVDVRRVRSTERSVLPRGEGSESILSREITGNVTQSQASRGAEPGVRSNVQMDIDRGGDSRTTLSDEHSEAEFQVAVGTREMLTIDPRGMPTRINATINLPREYVAALARQDGEPDVEPDAASLEEYFERERSRLEADIRPLVETFAVEEGQIPGTVVVSMIPVSLPQGGVGGPGQAGQVGGVVEGFSSLATGDLVKQVVLGAFAVAALLAMVLTVRKAARTRRVPTAEELVGIPPALASDDDLVGEAEESDNVMMGIEVDEEKIKAQKMLGEISELVKKNPETAAAVLNRWLQAEQ